MGKKVFVGNLSFGTSEDDLTEMFGEIGGVESVQVIRDRDTGRSKGFAFVEMADEISAEKAKQRFNGQEMHGRALTVNEAKPMQRREFGPSRGPEGGARERGHRGSYER
jgi:cold-inducible RNA-binding protein